MSSTSRMSTIVRSMTILLCDGRGTAARALAFVARARACGLLRGGRAARRCALACRLLRRALCRRLLPCRRLLRRGLLRRLLLRGCTAALRAARLLVDRRPRPLLCSLPGNPAFLVAFLDVFGLALLFRAVA